MLRMSDVILGGTCCKGDLWRMLVLLYQGEVGKEMYIVNKGIVEVLNGDKGDVLATLTKGSVFGEISLLGIPGCNRRTADVRSKGFSNLFVLSKDDLWEALKNYPEAQKVLKKKAKNIIKENEARAKAVRSRQESSSTTEDIPRQDDIEKSYTPKLVRTVMQVLPKSCHRIQPKTNDSTKTSFGSIPSVSSTNETQNIEYSGFTFRNTSSKKLTYRHKHSPSPPKVTPILTLKPRSMSDGTLGRPAPIPEHHCKSDKTDSKLFDFPFIIKKISPTKSEPCSYQQLNSGEDSPKSDDISSSGIFKKQFGNMDSTKQSPPHCGVKHHQLQSFFCGDTIKYQVTNKCFSQNLEAAETCLETQKEVVSDDSSDTTSTSTQKMTIDNSDDEMNDSSCPNSSWMSSSSSIPYLGNLFHQESNQSIASINKDVPSPPAIHQEDEQCNKMYMQKMFKENNDDKNSKSSSSTSSNSSSLLYLGGLFRHGSSQSSNSSIKDFPLSPFPQKEVENSENSTNGSSSAGYDNLAFVPSGIFSRRSSIFSNTSG
ncbi:cyclic nucleotide-gated cation channel beta-1 [Caerostris darwini]|uniref:Cyclic nucleotide-gated cation channel beta-1 n=1 Tax=Caerostris darwini TaxID=1538125 RepID=A0AAV4X342_9ARAC|nr:cyclic nucleotide-gated cation channel beta-1 [Caerostris darwini]